MTVNSQSEYDSLREKYKGKIATNKETRERYSIEDVVLNGYRNGEGITEFAVVILAALDPSYKNFNDPLPSVDFVLKYFDISE